ncbi:unnamed protein product [Auanema sp. JU1783]|nr:unnamed protein product [Auanema sp. JU1783]
MVYSHNTTLVTRRLKRIGENSVDSYRTLAKPLNPIHEDALKRFMHAQRLDIQQRYDNIFNEEIHDRLRDWEKLKSTIPLTAQKQMFKKFIFDEQLEAYRKLRHESKAAKLLQAVFQGITLQHNLLVSLGEKHFFEYLLQNTFPDPINCVIIIDHPGLKVILDEDEWLFYKKQNSLTTPIEKNMFHETKNGNYEVFLKPMESIYVPFIYEHFNISKEEDLNETKVLFRRWDNGEPVSILDLRIDQRPSCVHQTIRFYSEAACQFQKNLLISGIRGNRRILSIRSIDPTIKVALRNRGVEQELVISAFCGEAGSSRVIPLILYADSYMYRYNDRKVTF